jgi:hypothetical protein
MTTVHEFTGNWTYRSFINNPELGAKADEVFLAKADLILEVGGAGGASAGLEEGGVSAGLDLGGGSEISGKQSFRNGVNVYLTVSGTAEPGKPPTIRFRATGVKGTQTEGWIYDFIGYLAPFWPEGKEQRPAIVGTVIRTVPHKSLEGGEVRPAGVTLSFIAVSRDHLDDS